MLIAVPSSIDTLIIPLPHLLAKADPATFAEGRRHLFFETSREGVVDRQNEDIASDALWASRKLFLEQGNLDINHWSWLGNPPGSGMRPEYVIGHPTDVKRSGKSIYVQGEIFSSLTPPPPDSNGEWANKFWHSLTQTQPAMKWFPSVFGKIDTRGIEVQQRGGKTVRFITGPMLWFSVGFAQRAQHPALGSVSMLPVGPFANTGIIAKAVDTNRVQLSHNIAVMPLETFAKAITSAGLITSGDAGSLDSKGTLEGTQALRRESLEGSGTPSYAKLKTKILKMLLNKQIEGTLEHVTEAFKNAGAGEMAKKFAVRLGEEAADEYKKLS